MQSEKQQSYLFIGVQSRLIRCAEIALAKGQVVEGIITADPAVKAWAAEQDLKLIDLDTDWQQELQNTSFDYLISVDNPVIVPEGVLRLPRRLAINFHDAPLPRYAGVNATSWAIANGETEHGITWHLMSAKLDAGDTLKQTVFPVDSQETALSLNVLCYEKSIEAFADLVDDLATGSEQKTPQNLHDRSYFSLYKRPPAAAAINWYAPAAEIDRLVRSLDFGTYRNPLALPKVYLGDRVIFTQHLDILEPVPHVEPGTILAIAQDEIRIATSTHVVQLSEFQTPDGRRQDGPALLSSSGFGVSDVLPHLSVDQVSAITATHEKVARHESHWTSRLAELEPLVLDYKLPADPVGDDADIISAPFSAEKAFCEDKTFTTPPSFSGTGDAVLAALAIYFGRIFRTFRYDVAYSNSSLNETIAGMEPFFSTRVPLRIELDAAQNWREARAAVAAQLNETHAHGAFLNDLLLREPGLRDVAGGHMQMQVGVERVHTLAEDRPSAVNDLLMIIPDDGRKVI